MNNSVAEEIYVLYQVRGQVMQSCGNVVGPGTCCIFIAYGGINQRGVAMTLSWLWAISPWLSEHCRTEASHCRCASSAAKSCSPAGIVKLAVLCLQTHQLHTFHSSADLAAQALLAHGILY